MKNKNNNSKKIKISVATSSLLRFIQNKRRKRIHNSQRLETKSTFIETLQLPTRTKSTFIETLQLPTVKNAKQNKKVSHKIKESSENDLPAKVFIVKMPTKCCGKNVNILNIGVLHESVKDDLDKFTSLKCLMSTDNVVDMCAIDASDQNNFHNHLNKTTLSKQKQLTEHSDETGRKCFISVCTLDRKISTANIYELNCFKCLVLLQPGHLFYFIGIIELELLQGSVEVLGYSLNEQRKKFVLFSPKGYSHIFIKATENTDRLKQNTGFSIEDLQHLGLSEYLSRVVYRKAEKCSVFILSRKKDHVTWPQLFESHLPFSVLPQNDLIGPEQENRPCHLIESRIDCILDGNISEQGKEFIEMPEWTNVVEQITDQAFPKVILCGGKSVGKSTFLRYLINKLLIMMKKKKNKILVLDFDPGQCEFTVPGCLSISLVEEPLLGPNFSHLKRPIRCVFLGEVDVTKCPEDYIKGCKYLIQFARMKYGDIPWLVNTMGFTKGFGVALNCGIIKNVCPTNVIQIESKSSNLNFPSLLEPGFVNNQHVSSFSTDKDFMIYNLHIVPSATEFHTSTSQKIRGIGPQEARSLVILSYLSDMLKPGTTSLTQVTPYMINMEQIDLKMTDKGNLTKIQIAATMNGNMVALCQTENDEFPNCLGFGIVRGIDMQAGVLYLITPVSSLTLSKVNCLIKGNINLPQSLYYNQGQHVNGHIPYIAHTSGGSTALFAKRDYRTLPTTPRSTTKRQSR